MTREPVAAADAAARRRPRGASGHARRIAARFTGLMAMVGIAAFVVSVSVPAAAFYPPAEPEQAAPLSSEDAQSLESASTAEVEPVVRDDYTVTTYTEQLRAKYGSRNYAYRTNSNGTVQWPFPSAVPIASGFGDRLAPCSGCSSFHEGLDFNPGAGAAIGAIMTGVVSLVKSDRGGLGEHVVIDHVVNGQKVQSVYAHMRSGTIIVALGETVHVGQVVGLVGSTGASTGAHLHLEIHVNGVPVDPFAWLKANAN